jgi:acyl carrier protein
MQELDFLNQIKQITEVQVNLTFDNELNNQELFDSLALMSIAAWVFDNFDININVSELEKIGTLDKLYQFILKKS